MEHEEIDFLNEKKEKHGDKITFRSFATWFGSNSGLIRPHGVIIYRIKDTFYYEDFEHKKTILGFPLPPTKWERGNPYKKYESSFDLSQIESIYKVNLANANKVINQKLNTRVKKASPFDLIFRKVVTQIVLKGGEILFMELINHKEFEKFCPANNQ